MTLNFKGVVLDLDGLLLDTERVQFEVAPDVMKAMGHDLDPSFFQALVGVDRRTSTRLISEKIGVELDHATLDKAWNAAMRTHMQQGIPLRPGVHAFLDALDRFGLPRSIATNSLTERAEGKLRSVGLLSRMNAVVGVDQVNAGKPAPDVYIAAAERLGLNPFECVALDDSDLGVRAAMAAGMKTVIQVPDLVESRELHAHHQADSLEAALILLGLADESVPRTGIRNN